MKMRVLTVLAAILGTCFLAFGIWLLFLAHDYEILEMKAQFMEYGYYNSNIIILGNEHFCRRWCSIGGALLILFGLPLIALAIAGVWYWNSFTLFKEDDK